MTEAEWMAATDPAPMLDLLRGKVIHPDRLKGPILKPVPEFIKGQASDRRFRLLTVGWYRSVWPRLEDVGRRVIEVAERQADFPRRAEVAALRDELGEEIPLGLWAISDCGWFGADLAREQVQNFLVQLAGTEGWDRPELIRQLDAVDASQVDLLRDIFGNPFRPVALDPAWLTPTVTALARQMYETRDFGPMPILADALEDAGCDHPDVLAHCRGPGPHVRGCWAVDLVLGKS